MAVDLGDLSAFVAVARAKGFRDGARASGASASSLSEAVRRLETQLGVRLLHRTTRRVAPTEAGQGLLARLGPALGEVEAALDVIADDGFVDVLASGCDAGIRYDERLEQDMIAVPIGPRVQRFATAAAPAYLARSGRPEHPRDLLGHACLRGQFASGAMAAPWEFERDSEVVRIEPAGPLLVRIGAATDLMVEVAVAGTGIVHLFEDWLRPYLDAGALEPVLKPWWQRFSGPFVYYPGRRLVPAPLRAFLDFIRNPDLEGLARTGSKDVAPVVTAARE